MPKRILQGKVVSNKADKTVVVVVTRKFKHPVYKKFVTQRKKYMAHDAENGCQMGDVVSIIESAPISKRKRWSVVNAS